MKTLELSPVFGFGWFGMDGPIEVPTQFKVEIIRKKIYENGAIDFVGRVKEPGHVFDQLFARISPRTDRVPDTDYNVEIFSNEPADDILLKSGPNGSIYSGFATGPNLLH